MCVSPRIVDNPHYLSSNPLIQRIHNTSSSKIEVPCGKCSQCRSRKQTDLLQRVQMESLDSYVFMFTLTYNKNVPTYCLPNGNVLMRSNYKHIVDMFKRIRRQDYFQGRSFKYLVCSEYTPKRARPHYHGLLFLKKLPSDSRLEYVSLEQLVSKTLLHEWRVNIATRVVQKDSKKYKKGMIVPNTRSPKYIPLCDYKVTYRAGKKHCTFDCHYVTPNSTDGSNDVSFYVMKYLFKAGSGEKFVQAACYKSGVSKNHAQQLYTLFFKSGSRKSLNFGSKYTDSSYRSHQTLSRKVKLDNSTSLPDVYKYFEHLFALQSTPLLPAESTQGYINKFVNFSQANKEGLSFYDIYTGKRMPLSRYYESLVSPDILLSFREQLRQEIDSGELTDKCIKLDKAMSKFRNQSKRTMVTDLFDDDQIIDVSIEENDLPDPSIFRQCEEDNFTSLEISPDPFWDGEDLPDPMPYDKLCIQLQLFNS